MEAKTTPGNNNLGGMTGFTLVWIGQLVSVLATNMSGFALTIWAFEKTRSATVLGLIQLAFILPFLLISPIAGAMVDRYNRKLMMMVSDLGAVLATSIILILNALGQLEIWHMCVASVIFGLSNAFQWPAYLAAISTMVSKEQYSRANGMLSLVESGPQVFSPLLAGALLPFIGLTGILIIDVLTFFLAIGALFIVHVPQPVLTEEGQAGKGNLIKEAGYGFKYIFARRSLLSLLLVILGLNLVGGFSQSLLAPMILLRTNNNSASLGAIEFCVRDRGSGRRVSRKRLGWFQEAHPRHGYWLESVCLLWPDSVWPCQKHGDVDSDRLLCSH